MHEFMKLAADGVSNYMYVYHIHVGVRAIQILTCDLMYRI